MRRIIIAGATGSIGTQALEVIRYHPDRFTVVGLTAHRQREAVEAQAAEFGDPAVALGAEEAEALVREVDADVVINGITGSIGLGVTLASLETGKQLALANKESLIVGGELVTRAARPGQIIPVDSEHSALAQCLRGGREAEVRRVVLTASGGPFRGFSREQLSRVTPAQALRHPTWDMGVVVTTNSATLVNKGLEVIEASLLFDLPYDRIEVVVHPQSIVHSMVEFCDNSTLVQASVPDMRLPIGLALGWPERIEATVEPLSWRSASEWTFEPLDEEAFPAVRLAKQVGAAGRGYPAVYNAANEQAVAAFHAGAIGFTRITEVIEETVAAFDAPTVVPDREHLGVIEGWARRHADGVIGHRAAS